MKMDGDPNKPTYNLLAAIAEALGKTKVDHATAWVFMRTVNDYLEEERYFWRLAFRPDMSGYFVANKDYRPNIQPPVVFSGEEVP